MQVFKKVQAMAGFGAAVGKLRDFELISDGFSEIEQATENITIDDPTDFLDSINRNLHWIKENTKKIGNAQRAFFHYFFRGMLNPEDDSYQDPIAASDSALRKYQSQNL